jgi:ribonuclease T1
MAPESHGWLKHAVAVVVVIAAIVLSRGGFWGKNPQPGAAPTRPAQTEPSSSPSSAPPVANTSSAQQERSASDLPDDVGSTLQRISRGESFPHRDDGTVFGNRERLLPEKAYGYYHEYVHPTPGVRGPGARRVVIGQEGDVYYTADHYRSFVKLPTTFRRSS